MKPQEINLARSMDLWFHDALPGHLRPIHVGMPDSQAFYVAIKTEQRRLGIAEDGVLGLATLAAMEAAYGTDARRTTQSVGKARRRKRTT